MAKNAEVKNMFAVVEVSGNQYLVEEGKRYSVKKLDSLKGDTYNCDTVLLISDGTKTTVGKPYIDGAKVEFLVDAQIKGEKIDTFKYTAKSRFRKRSGSRALITKIIVKKIVTK
jgi:large subunit ribosomal protein L21